MMTQGTWSMPPSLRHPARPRTKSSNAIRRCIRPRKASVALWHEGHIGVDAKSGLTHSPVTTAANGMTSISWVICCTEEQFVSADAGYQGRHSARIGRGGWTG